MLASGVYLDSRELQSLLSYSEVVEQPAGYAIHNGVLFEGCIVLDFGHIVFYSTSALKQSNVQNEKNFSCLVACKRVFTWIVWPESGD
jgi:hypothetical protein